MGKFLTLRALIILRNFFVNIFLCILTFTLAVQPVAAQEKAFDVLEYVVEGNSVLDAVRIEEAVYPHLGLKRTIKDVEAARDALEKAYQNAGFLTVSVDIPEQAVSGGIVILKVGEGKVDRLAIKGSKFYAASVIRDAVPELASGSVPNAGQVQNEISALNRSNNRRVTPALKPGKTPGTVDAELMVDDTRPISGAVNLSNFKTASGSTLRLGTDLRFENIGGGTLVNGHSLSLSLTATPQDWKETRVYSLNYLAPTRQYGTFMLYGVRSDSESLEPVGSTLVQGKLRLIGLRYFTTLSERSGQRMSLALGVDRKSNEQLVATPNGLGALTYYPISASFNATIGTAQDQWKLDTGVVFGVGRGAKSQTDFAQRRLSASPDFTVLKLDLSNDRSLTPSIRLKARVSGQLTNGPLINLEQISAGGYESVRGYFEAEQIGDRGIRASTELSYSAYSGSGFLQRLELVGFYDASKLTVISAAVGQTNRFFLASVGVGARLRLWSSVNLTSELAYPLKASSQTRKGDWRLLAKLSYEY